MKSKDLIYQCLLRLLLRKGTTCSNKKAIKVLESPKNINKNKILLGDFNSTDIFNYSNKQKQLL